MTQDTTPTEEKKEGFSDFAAGIILTVGCVFAAIGMLFIIWHSGTILGFVFKPWMQDDIHHKLEQEIAGLRYHIEQCADQDSIARRNYGSIIIVQKNGKLGATSTQKTLEDCLKNL